MSSPRHLNRPAASVACSSKHPAALVACSSTRWRRKVADAAAAATRDSSPWASLHEDLVSQIGWRVLTAGDVVDYIRFRAVCFHWRSSTTCPRGRGIVDPRFHPRRWMLFPEGHGLHPGHGKLGGYVRFFNLSTGAFVRFFNLSTGAFVRVPLPLFRDHCVLDSVDGILLLQRDHDTAIRLLHPFTGDIAEFPPLETLLPYVSPRFRGAKRRYLRTIRAACISVGADGVVNVMMSLLGLQKLSFATSGDQQWSVSSWLDKYSVALPFQGKFYMLHRPEVGGGKQEVLQVDPPQQEDMNIGSPSLPPPKLIAKCPASTGSAFVSYDLVECNSEVLVIASRFVEEKRYSIYRLADLMPERIVPLTCIDGSTLFLSKRRSLYISSEAFPTIVADTIGFFDTRENYLAQYHLISGTSSAASDGCTKGIANLSPCSIIYRIFTCCFRYYWNKGEIFRHEKLKQPWRVKRKWREGVSLTSVAKTLL